MIKGELLQTYGGFTCKVPAIIIQNVIVSDLIGNVFPDPLDALIDTGADRTVVPMRICRELQLKILDRPLVRGFDEQAKLCPIYWVNLKIEGVGDIALKAFGVQRKSILLGRDFLENMLMIMDNRDLNYSVGVSKRWKILWFKLIGVL